MQQSKQRTLIKDCLTEIGETVTVSGWVHTVRAHGKIAFFDLRDRSGILQIGAFTPELAKAAAALGSQDVVNVEGLVKKRDERYINKSTPTGTIELEAKEIKIIEKSAEMPFDMGGKELNLELPTLLDYRSLTLRHPKQQVIFKVQEAIADGFRKAAKELDCTEIFIPTLAPAATEGGADVFKVQYFNHSAYLTQSPQLYKQIMVAVLERVFMFAHAYRAEPSVTTRHLTEVVQMDCEFAFATFEQLLDYLEFVGTSMIKYASEQKENELKLFNIEKPRIPVKVPRLKLREAQEIVSKRTGRDLSKELDLNPEDEKDICEWAKDEHQSDFVTITHFPTQKRAFYTLPDPEDPEYSLSYDLLFKGIEICSGSRRVNNYNQLLQIMKERNIDSKNFGLYLQTFKYGVPPEGGFSFGLERLTMKLLELGNVREASLFPRDMERIDERFSQKDSDKNQA